MPIRTFALFSIPRPLNIQQTGLGLSAVKIRLIGGEIATHLITEEELNYEKILGHLSANNFDSSEVKAVIASLHFILNNAAKYSVLEDVLANELTQLGLPKEHSEGLSKVYSKAKADIRNTFDKASLQLNKLSTVDWRLDYILSSSSLQDLNSPSVQLRLQVTKSVADSSGNSETVAFELNSDKFRVLLAELKAARGLMEGL